MRTLLPTLASILLITASCGGPRGERSSSENASGGIGVAASAPAKDYSKETNPDVLLDALEKQLPSVEAAARKANVANTASMEAYGAAMESLGPLQTRLGELMDAEKLNMGQISRNLQLSARLSQIAGIPLGMGDNMMAGTRQNPAAAAEIDGKLAAYENVVTALEAESKKVLVAEGGKSFTTQQGKYDAIYDARKKTADSLYDELLNMDDLSVTQFQRMQTIQSRHSDAVVQRYSITR